jgi:hypothetical protein
MDEQGTKQASAGAPQTEKSPGEKPQMVQQLLTAASFFLR